MQIAESAGFLWSETFRSVDVLRERMFRRSMRPTISYTDAELMDHAMMASRVTLLLLVTGLFAAMWSGDRADERTTAQLLLTRRTSPPTANQRSGARPISTAARPVSRYRGEQSLQTVPLPSGIAVGTYLVVDATGRNEARVVTAADAFPNGVISGHVAKDEYTMRSGPERWHFIRLAESASVAARRGPMRRPLTERVQTVARPQADSTREAIRR